MITLKNGDVFTTNRDKSGRDRYVLLKANGGKLYLTGCTTITGMEAKPYLIDWAASEAYKDAKGKSSTEIAEIIKNKNWAHTRKSDDAKSSGTDAHSLVEEFTQYYISNKKYNTKLLDNKDIDKGVRISVQRFINWAVKDEVEFISAEEAVLNGELLFAGSYDFICRIKGKVYLGDFKTSKKIDGTYYAQCAGYVNAKNWTERATGQKETVFDGIIVVKSSKEEEDFVKYTKTSTGAFKKEVTPAFEAGIKTDLDKQMGYFNALLYIYRMNKNQFIKEFNEAPIAPLDYTDEIPEIETK